MTIIHKSSLLNPPDFEKQISLQVKVLERLTKEHSSYIKEADLQQQRIDKMKAIDADSYDIKKQYEVLSESLDMIPDCLKRLEKAKESLSHLISSCPTEDASPSLVEARRLLA